MVPSTTPGRVANPVIDERFRVVLGTPNLGVKKRGGTRSEITIKDDDAGTVNPPPAGPPSLTVTPPTLPAL